MGLLGLPFRLRDLYQDATSPCGGSDCVSAVLLGVAAYPHSSYESRAGTNFGALAVRRREAWNPADDDSVCHGSSGASPIDSWPVSCGLFSAGAAL